MLKNNVLLSKYSNYKIGGKAKYFLAAKNTKEIIDALKKYRGKFFILGAGTNVLFDDNGFDGLVIKPEFKFIKKNGNNLRVGAGILMSELINYTIKNGLTGLEWAGGLPGTVGGAIYGNAGAFGGETGERIVEVRSLDLVSFRSRNKFGMTVIRSKKSCKFGYRNSIFKENAGKEIIVEAVFKLKQGNKKEIKKGVWKKIAHRKKYQPLEYPSIGSTFKNFPVARIKPRHKKLKIDLRKGRLPVKGDPFPVVPAAYLISETRLQGVSYGGAMISPKHPNFIVNTLAASSQDVNNLIVLVKKEVKKKFGVELEEEIIRLG